MSHLPPTRELRERLDTAQLLTRLFYRERAVALAADALRERVFELRYPSRLRDEQAEEIAIDAPVARATPSGSRADPSVHRRTRQDP